MATYRHWSVSLCRDPDDVSHCRILLPDKTEWRLISATLYGWRRCFVADQLWLMKRIREEEECQLCHNNPDLEVKGQGQSWRRHHSEPLQSSSYPSLTFQWTSWFIVFEARVSAANKIIHRMGEWQKLTWWVMWPEFSSWYAIWSGMLYGVCSLQPEREFGLCKHGWLDAADVCELHWTWVGCAATTRSRSFCQRN